MERLKNVLLGALLLACAAGLACFPTECAEAARGGLKLALEAVLPSLFPFFVLATLCAESGAIDPLGRALAGLMRPLFGLGGAAAGALALGLLGGYGVGARTAAELYRAGSLSREEAERLLALCNNAGAGFVLGVCGGAVLRDARAGACLYLVHAASALLTGALLRRRESGGAAEAARALPPHGGRRASFPRAVAEAFASAWTVCGFVVLFAVLLRLLTLALPEGAAAQGWYPLLPGFFEVTNGVLALPGGRAGFVGCAALLGWGGLSVHAQTLSILDGTGLSARWYFTGKIMQAALSVPLAWWVAFWLY